MYLMAVPVVLLGTINGSILVSLHALLLRGIIEIIACSLDIGLLYYFLTSLKWGLHSAIYSYMIARVTAEVMHYCYIYQPKHIKKFLLLKKASWNFFEKEFLESFLVDSTYNMGRGLLLLVQYMVAPIVASRTGTYRLSAYSFMITLFFYPAVITDSIGITASYKGALYLGTGRYSYYRKLTLYLPLVSVCVGFLFVTCYWLLREPLFNSFSTNPHVQTEMNDNSIYWISAVATGMLPGSFEGLCTAKLKFPLLFWTMFGAILSWGIITTINLIFYESLVLIWAALGTFMWMRFVPPFVVTCLETYWDRQKADTEERKEWDIQ